MNGAHADTTSTSTSSRDATTRQAVTEFESRLAYRTKVPSERLHEFLEWPLYKLRRETEHVCRILKRIAEAVVNSMENPSSTNEFLRTLDLKSISRDHDWRAIFSTIRAQESGCEDYKRTVLIRYLQYLSFRKRLLEYIYSRKQGLDDTDAHADLTEYPSPAMAIPAPEDFDPTGFEPGSLDDDEEEDARGFVGDFRRLPMGEVIEVRLTKGEKLDIMLAGHLFRLIGGQPPSLIDQNGVTYFLKEGRNMVGRHPESDVPVDQNFSDVSRAHLIVEWDSEGRVTIIDLSSRGSFVRRHVLEAALTLDTPEHAFDLPGWQGETREVTIN